MTAWDVANSSQSPPKLVNTAWVKSTLDFCWGLAGQKEMSLNHGQLLLHKQVCKDLHTQLNQQQSAEYASNEVAPDVHRCVSKRTGLRNRHAQEKLLKSDGRQGAC